MQHRFNRPLTALLASAMFIASALGSPGPVRAATARPPVQAAAPFGDIAGLWDASDVLRLASLGIIRGEPGGRFGPSEPVQRVALAALIQRTFKLPDPVPRKPHFSDVPLSNWGVAVVQAVYRAGWMRGVGSGMFMPAYPVTRAQAVTALARALRLRPGPVAHFTDEAAIPPWAAQAVDAAVAAHLVRGYPDGSFRPGAALNRADAAHLFALVYQLLNPPPPPPPPQPPATPQGVYLTSYRDHADVVWKVVPGASRYEVEREPAADGGTWAHVGTTSGRVWGDYHASPTVPYSYRVVAVGPTGLRSAPSQAVTEPTLSAAQALWAASVKFSVATLVGVQAAAAVGPGTPFGLGGLNVQRLAALPVARSDTSNATLLLSDDPETVSSVPALLYEATASGPVRALFDHINGTAGPAQFAVVLQNPGRATVSWAVYARVETTTGGPKAQGRAVVGLLLSPPSPTAVAGGVLGPGQAAAVDPGGAVLQPQDAVVGDFELRLSGPARVAFAMVPAGQDPVALLQAGRLPPAPLADGAGRGTFLTTVRTLDLTLASALPEVTQLGDGTQDTYIAGQDALGSKAAVDTGNYGVLYHIVGQPQVPTAIVGVPMGGAYYGALATGGDVFTAPTYPLSGGGASGFLMALWPAGQMSEITWTPPPGSYLPLELVTIPLP